MEELIWKYLDNECTEEEKVKVADLLVTDVDFKVLFDHCSNVNRLLEQEMNAAISEDLKNIIKDKLEDQLKPRGILEIFPLWYAIPLGVVGVLTLIFAFNMPSHSASLQMELPFDEKTLKIATWCFVSFSTLFLIDFITTKSHIFKKPTFMFA
jgi:hypothetical protein